MSAFLIVWCLDPNYSKGKLPGTGISPDLRVLPLGSSDYGQMIVHTSYTVTFRKVQL